MRFQVEEPGRAERLRVHVRGAGEAVYLTLDSTKTVERAFEAILPGERLRAPELQYRVELLDRAGSPLLRAGTAEAPLRVAVRPSSAISVHKKAWFWVAVIGGAAVAAVAVGVGVGVGLGH